MLSFSHQTCVSELARKKNVCTRCSCYDQCPSAMGRGGFLGRYTSKRSPSFAVCGSAASSKGYSWFDVYGVCILWVIGKNETWWASRCCVVFVPLGLQYCSRSCNQPIQRCLGTLRLDASSRIPQTVRQHKNMQKWVEMKVTNTPVNVLLSLCVRKRTKIVQKGKKSRLV